MAIKVEKSRGKTLILAEGKVDGFYINPIPADKIKTYGDWTPTHRYNIVVDGDRISLGMGDKDGVSERQGIRAKDTQDEYTDLLKGCEVSISVAENGEYQGKKQYQAKLSDVIITSSENAVQKVAKGGAAAGGAAPAAGGGRSFDKTGVEVGHAVNGAMNFILGFQIDPTDDNIVRYAGSVHNVTTKMKKAVAEKNPGKSEYDVGASVGHAVLNACKLVGVDNDFEQVLETIAYDLLNNVVSKVEEIVKTGKGAAKPAARTPAARKPAGGARKAKDVPAETPQEPEQPKQGFDDMDDDIPF